MPSIFGSQPEVIRRYRKNPVPSPDETGTMWAMGPGGPYRAYGAGMSHNDRARANAVIFARGDYFIDPPKSKKKVKGLRAAWQALNRR